MNNSTDQTEPNSPFHAGELMAQHRAGVRDRADANGRRGIRGHMPEQHRDFFGQLPFIVIGALDDAGHPCASLLMGAPGFMHAPDAQSLQVQALPDVGDPLCGALRVGCDVGLLGIELETRRRNRLNGSLTSMDQDGFRIAVSQSFGNCQKYIQCRTLAPRQQSAAPLQALSAHSLDESSVALIQAADTFFIATHASSPGRAGTGGLMFPTGAASQALFWSRLTTHCFGPTSLAMPSSTPSATCSSIQRPGFCSRTSFREICCTSPGDVKSFGRERKSMLLSAQSASCASA